MGIVQGTVQTIREGETEMIWIVLGFVAFVCLVLAVLMEVE